MPKLTKSQRKVVEQKLAAQQHTEQNLTLEQHNTYHMGASEIDALHRMQDFHPNLVEQIMGFRQQELDIQKNVVGIEDEEQKMRKREAPFIRIYAFLGQLMAYSISVATLVGGAYFGIQGQEVVAGLFLSSTVGVAYIQFSRKQPKSATE